MLCLRIIQFDEELKNKALLGDDVSLKELEQQRSKEGKEKIIELIKQQHNNTASYIEESVKENNVRQKNLGLLYSSDFKRRRARRI